MKSWGVSKTFAQLPTCLIPFCLHLLIHYRVEADAVAALPNLSKNRDVAEVQDLYRRTLAASWTRQPSELPTDECIEDIFSGGNGWRTKHRSATSPDSEDDYYDEDGENSGTLRPNEFRRMAMNHRRNHSNSSSQFRPGSSYQHHSPHSHHRRTLSGSSDKSVSTVTGGGNRSALKKGVRILRDDGRETPSRDDDMVSTRSAGSLASLAPTLGSSEREREHMKRAKEIGESDVRDDLVAWSLPGVAA